MSKISPATFNAIDAANPHIWELFQQFTFQMIGRGFKHWSARAVLHRVRWETAAVQDDPEFKVNDHLSMYYARKFHNEFPTHLGFFRNRASHADSTNWNVNMSTTTPPAPSPTRLSLEKIAAYLEGLSPDPLVAAGALRRLLVNVP